MNIFILVNNNIIAIYLLLDEKHKYIKTLFKIKPENKWTIKKRRIFDNKYTTYN